MYHNTIKAPLNESQLPLLRDISNNHYEPLERFFGTLTPGCAFGESCLLGNESSALTEKPRFYQAIALTDCYYITLHMTSLRRIMKGHEDRIEKDRVDFLKLIPEFSLLSGTLIKKLSRELKPLPFHKDKLVYNAGDPSNYVYFVIRGKFSVQRSI